MKSELKFFPIFLWIGVGIPAALNLYFVFKFGITTVIADEWRIVMVLGQLFSGENWLSSLLLNQNEHFTFFPQLIIIILAYFTSFNLLIEAIVGWGISSLILLVLWKLLRQTIPEGRWLIIPLAWLNYSLAAFTDTIWGFPSIQYHLTLLSLVCVIYFLNKIKYSVKSIYFVIAFLIIGPLSHLIGLIAWFVGWFSFKDLSKSRRVFFVYLISGLVILGAYYFGIREYLSSGNRGLSAAAVDPLGLLGYVIVYLGNSPNISLIGLWPKIFKTYLKSIDPVLFALFIGSIILTIFIIMILLHFRKGVSNISKHNITPWIQIAFFSLLSAVVTGIGRLDIGIEQALTPRYVPMSNLFLGATLVIGFIVFFEGIQKAKTSKNKKILKMISIILITFLCLHIALSYIEGWVWGEKWSNKHNSTIPCLLNFETATDECLEKILQGDNGPKFVRKHSPVLRDFCLGPFADICKN